MRNGSVSLLGLLKIQNVCFLMLGFQRMSGACISIGKVYMLVLLGLLVLIVTFCNLCMLKVP